MFEDVESLEARLSDAHDSEVAQYKAVSGLAVTALIAGLLAPLALVLSVAQVIPPTGIVLSALALWQIFRKAPALIGRKAAMFGLVSSVLFAAAVPSQQIVYRCLMYSEARQFTALWFDMLRRNQPYMAYALRESPAYRQTLTEESRGDFSDPREREEFDNWLARPAIKSLLILADRAQVRLYENQRYFTEHDRDAVDQVYAVTYQEDGQKKSFFVRLSLRRSQLADSNQHDWYVANIDSEFRPAFMRPEDDRNG